MKDNRPHPLIFIIGISIFIASGCKKETSQASSSSSASSMHFALNAVNTAVSLNTVQPGPAGATSRVNGVTIQWISGSATATLIKFEAKNAADEVEFKSTVQQTVNLFDSNAMIGNISIPKGSYKEIEFKAELNAVSGNHSIDLEGQVSGIPGINSIHFQSDENIEIKGGKDSVTITDGNANNVKTLIDLSMASQAITTTDLSNAVQANGVVLISQDINKDLYKRIVANLRHLEREAEFHH
jgi:hypothetical protein